jgi:hypothetical protein
MRARFAGTIALVGGLLAASLGSGSLPSLSASGLSLAAASASQKAAVAEWVEAHEATFTKLSTAFSAAAKAADARKVGTLHTDCLGLKVLMVKVQKVPAIPDAVIEKLWKSTLTNLVTGTKDCVNGTSASGNLNPVLLKHAAQDWQTGGTDMVRVASELNKLVNG